MSPSSRQFGSIGALSVTAVVTAVALFAVTVGGCSDTRYTVRQVDQHVTGEFTTVKTGNERTIGVAPIYEYVEFLGIVFWKCHQSEDKLVCARVCDERWEDGRICQPELHREFGQVTRPGADVVSAPFRARVQELEMKLAEDDDRQVADQSDDGTPGDGEVEDQEPDDSEEGRDHADE